MLTDFDMLLDELAERVASRIAEQAKQKSFQVLHIVLIKDAAAYLGCTVKQVNSMVRTGAIPAVRHFDKLFVAVEDLDGWLAAHKKALKTKRPR